MFRQGFVEIGFLIGPHGIKGEVKVKSFTEIPENLLFYEEFFLGLETKPIKLRLVRKIKQNLLCVVEDIRDVMAIENTGQFQGIYHVLGGIISPMDGIGPKDLKIDSLVEKVKIGEVEEIIFALSATMEADTTNFYIYKLIQPYSVKTSTIARGIPVGDELEYTDEVTLGRSILARIPFESSITKN